MYAEVIVLTYQAPDIGTFTYEIPKNLEGKVKIGQLVEVPFGNRSPVGVVIGQRSESRNVLELTQPDFAKALTGRQGHTSTPPKNIKPINSIIFQTPILLSHQIKLLKWMAFYYHAPMVNCLKAILPELPAKLSNYSSSGVKRNREVSSENKFSTSSNNIQKAVKQTLVLVPTINRLPETLAKFPGAKNYVLYHTEQKPADRFATWLKIIQGNIDYVFGSRSAIFTPCPNLAKIIIFDEHDNAYKDERSPYFDSLTVAEKLQELTAAKIQIIDSSPKITTYFNNRQNIQIPRHKVPTVIVSMNDERRKGNYSILCNYLNSTLAKITKSNSRTLLFLNKKSGSGHLYCKSCQYQQYLPNKPEVCPNCQSLSFYFNSLNIWSLTETVKQIVSKSSINLIAEGIRHPALPAVRPTSDIRHPTIDIATSSVLYRLLPQKYDLVVHIATDSTLNIADFTSGEKTFAEICALKNLTANGGQLILQTYNPDHPILKNAAQNNYLSYFAQSLAERKALNFPPFALLIKLTIKGKDKETLEKKAEKLAQDLGSLPTTHYPLRPQSETSPLPTTILGPYESIFSAKVPSYNIILKHKLNTYSLIEREKARQNLEIYLQKVPRDFQITIEPANIN